MYCTVVSLIDFRTIKNIATYCVPSNVQQIFYSRYNTRALYTEGEWILHGKQKACVCEILFGGAYFRPFLKRLKCNQHKKHDEGGQKHHFPPRHWTQSIDTVARREAEVLSDTIEQSSSASFPSVSFFNNRFVLGSQTSITCCCFFCHGRNVGPWYRTKSEPPSHFEA